MLKVADKSILYNYTGLNFSREVDITRFKHSRYAIRGVLTHKFPSLIIEMRPSSAVGLFQGRDLL